MSAEQAFSPVHLCPLLVLHGERGGLTPFNRLPLSIGLQAYRLFRLASTPFHFFRFLGGEVSGGETHPLDLWFYQEGDRLGSPAQVFGRPVVLWTAKASAGDLVRAICQAPPLFLLLVSEDETVLQELEAAARGSLLVGTAYVGGETFLAADASRIVWIRYLELLQTLLSEVGAVTEGSPAQPEFRTPVSWEQMTESARNGSITPWSQLVPALPVADDFVAGPNQVLLNLARLKLPEWSGGPLEVDQAHLAAARAALEILAWRGLTNLLLLLRQCEGPEEARQFLKLLPDDFHEPVLRISGAAPEDFSSVFAAGTQSLPLEALASYSPRQLLFVCPCASLAPASAQGLTLGTKDALEELAAKEPGYFAHVLERIAAPGRLFQVLPPQNEDQEALVRGFLAAVRMESQHLSALSLLYATRFLSPVLKFDRCGNEVFDAFTDVDEIVSSMDSSAADPMSVDRETTLRLERAVAHLSRYSTSLVPTPVFDLLRAPDPLVHAFSDYPLEFIQVAGDYLGYHAELSRTPLTPGHVPLLNYQATELTTVLPTRPEDFLLVTPFEEDDPFLAAVLASKPAHVPRFRRQLVRRRDDLLERLQDESIRCLVYFGHGGYDSGGDSSALQLQTEFFGSDDIARAARIPPLIVLVGCNTASARTVLGGLHISLFERGAHLLVGTSFPVPKYIGAQFLALFISNLLSPGVLTGPNSGLSYRDLAHIVAVVRRRLRTPSDLFSLEGQGRISTDQHGALITEHSKRLSALPLGERADDLSSRRILAELLAENRLIESAEVPPVEWGAIPYPLFFSVLGFPWTRRNANWG